MSVRLHVLCEKSKSWGGSLTLDNEQWAEPAVNLCVSVCWLAPRSWALCVRDVCVCVCGFTSMVRLPHWYMKTQCCFYISPVNHRRWISGEAADRGGVWMYAHRSRMCGSLHACVCRRSCFYRKFKFPFFLALLVCNFLSSLCPPIPLIVSPPSSTQPLLYSVTHVYSPLRNNRRSSPCRLSFLSNFTPLKQRRGTSLILSILFSGSIKGKCDFSCFCLALGSPSVSFPFSVLSHFILPQLLLCSVRVGMLSVWCRNFLLCVLPFIAPGDCPDWAVWCSGLCLFFA